MNIPFNKPCSTGKELGYLEQAIANQKLSGDGPFTQKCHELLSGMLGGSKTLLTHSCTAALEMAALLCNIQPGDEVIMPSYTFVSTANAFALRGAKIVFVDIRPDTMNIDETLIEGAITDRTRVVVPVHYAGVACEMNVIQSLAKKHGLYMVEDAAQAIMAYYHDKPLGTLGDVGCFSFHETKNIVCGEGGSIALNNDSFTHQAEIIREKGTNRSRFLRGQVDKYTWVDIGSSYLPSELNAAYLLAQLESANEVNQDRLRSWDTYMRALKPLAAEGLVELPTVPHDRRHNAHMFYIKVADIEERTKLIEYLKDKGIMAVFHYVPLHSSEAGMRFGRFCGEDKWTTRESERLLRLPMYFGLKENEILYIGEAITEFFR
ncbi:MAG: dTDP-4-amino-4,6-dideoxygalactose transaminase [Candidatus Saccharibacteria bacterium]